MISSETSSDLKVPLAPPGAGLPKPELFIARLIFGKMRRKSSRQDVDERFDRERAKVVELARSVSPEAGAEQILIKRLRGLEDSSRNWSIFMALDHLCIVNHVVEAVARSLGRGESHSGVVSTAEVKPTPGVGAEKIEEFEQSCRTLAEAFAEISDLHTARSHPHPWFGSLDAAGWHALSAFHTRLHRKQIEQILVDLAPAAD